MNITKETIAENNDVIRIHLSPDDYQPVVNKEIKKTARTIQLPGFRPGHVPENMVRNRYGKAILMDEINRLVTDSLYKYFEENKIEIFGHPLPVDSENAANNFEKPGDFRFAFEVGIRPPFTVNLPPKKVPEKYVITVSPAEVDRAVEDLRLKYGQTIQPEAVDAECYIKVRFTSCSEEGQPVDNALESTVWFKPASLNNSQAASALNGLKTGDKKAINLLELTGSVSGISNLLNKKAEETEMHGPWYEMEILLIEKTIPAELNQELFDKAFGKDVVSDESAFRAKVEASLAGEYQIESDHKLHHDIKDVLVEETAISLPEAFLKKWILASSEKPVSSEDLEKNFRHYVYDLKWNMIRNRLIQDFKITVTDDELLNYGRHYVMRMLSQYGITSFDPGRLDDMASRYVKDEKARSEAESHILERKVFETLAGQIKTRESGVTLDQFIEIVKNHRY